MGLISKKYIKKGDLFINIDKIKACFEGDKKVYSIERVIDEKTGQKYSIDILKSTEKDGSKTQNIYTTIGLNKIIGIDEPAELLIISDDGEVTEDVAIDTLFSLAVYYNRCCKRDDMTATVVQYNFISKSNYLKNFYPEGYKRNLYLSFVDLFDDNNNLLNEDIKFKQVFAMTDLELQATCGFEAM